MHSRIVQLARALAGRRPTIFNKRLQRRGASICPISVFAATQTGNSIHCFSLAIGQFALDSATFTGYIERTISFAANVACTKPASFLDVTRTRRITENGDQVEHLILQAIANGRLIEFYYRNLPRIVEPHIYGVTNGARQILGYQTGGQSSNGGLPDWRRFDLVQMSRLTILAETFPGRRPVPSGKHSSWDLRLAIVG
jgi:hypothetical protein